METGKDEDAASTLARYVLDHVTGRKCDVHVVEADEVAMVPDENGVPQRKIVKRKQVAYGGYRPLEVPAGTPTPAPAESAAPAPTPGDANEDDIPF